MGNRKRRTDRGITCPSAIQSQTEGDLRSGGEGGARGTHPAFTRGGGGWYPIQSSPGGIPYPAFTCGVPLSSLMGLPPIRLDGVPPPPQIKLDGGIPLVDRQTFPSINITFPCTLYAVGNNVMRHLWNFKQYSPAY